MPSIFEISVAAFAIGMATNANVPNNVPQPKPQVIVEQAQDAEAVPVPAPKPATETDVAQAAPQTSDAAQ